MTSCFNAQCYMKQRYTNLTQQECIILLQLLISVGVVTTIWPYNIVYVILLANIDSITLIG